VVENMVEIDPNSVRLIDAWVVHCTTSRRLLVWGIGASHSALVKECPEAVRGQGCRGLTPLHYLFFAVTRLDRQALVEVAEFLLNLFPGSLTMTDKLHHYE
jgi:hypothetical protein